MENNKKVFNANKTQELTNYDLKLGKLIEDKLFVFHHEPVAEVAEVSHSEIVKTYANGGHELKTVIDIPHSEAKEAYDEYEDIYIFVPFTVEEIAKKKERDYNNSIVNKIREKYSLNDELALHRQRDTKVGEWAEYNAYCESCKSQAKMEV